VAIYEASPGSMNSMLAGRLEFKPAMKAVKIPPIPKPARTSNDPEKTGSRVAARDDTVCSLVGFVSWAAEVCSAEATELPVWKRPPVSVANGFCHP